MSSIQVRDLTAELPGGFRLGPLSLDVAVGARVAVLGPSGCGKTTLLRCLAGLETPRGGTIRIGDRAVFDGRERVRPSERKIGFVFQDAALWPHMTAVEHLRFVDPASSRDAAIEMLRRVGLEAHADRRPATLSGGEAQRLALVRALAGAPEVLLLDEPLSSLDVPLRDELALLIHRLCEERSMTLMVVTHDRQEALTMGDELVVMRAGRIVEAGLPARVLREPATAFGAKFVGGASALPVERGSNGSVSTPFGVFEAPSRHEGGLELVVLPGDIVVADDGGATGRVVRVVPAVDRAIATVEIDGRTVQVACAESTLPGDRLTLGLCGAPRLLPAEEIE